MSIIAPSVSGSLATIVTRDARWIVSIAAVYVVLVLVTVFTIHPYFSQTWDVVTFVDAGKSALSPEWSDLYAQSRADRRWPYAYPPLHAFVVAPFVALAGIIPDYVMVRVPPLLFDVALGILLYAILARKTGNTNLARLGMLVWLLNPVTWYDTAVQGHFEAEWLFFVVLGYFLFEMKRGWLWPTLALSVAFLFKQNAVLFALPMWAQILLGDGDTKFSRRILVLCASFLIYLLPIVLVSLPFLLASGDYWYMNVQYVRDVPLQTQSWLVALAGLFGADNVLLRESALLTFVAAVFISFFGARRKMDVWLIAALIALAFVLLSKKVMGYYYVMLLPFVLASLVPTRRFRVLSLIVVAVAFISLSPYFASWANQDHVWYYSALGIVNSVLWSGICVWLWRERRETKEIGGIRATACLSLALFLASVAGALLQPVINSQTSPIRAPLIAQGSETHAAIVFVGFGALVLVGTVAAMFVTRSIARTPPMSPGVYALVGLLAPLYFLTFTLTKESTTALEWFLRSVGQ